MRQTGGFAVGETSTRSNPRDRKSTRLNSSHRQISYAAFCLKKKNTGGPVAHRPARRDVALPGESTTPSALAVQHPPPPPPARHLRPPSPATSRSGHAGNTTP